MTGTTPERPPRYTARGVLLATVVTLFALASAWMAWAGDTRGYLGVLLFGGGGAFMLYRWVTDGQRHRHAAIRDPAALRHGTLAGVERYAPSSGVVCRAGRGAVLAPLAAGLVMAGIGVLSLVLAVTESRTDLLIAGALALGLTALSVPSLLPRLFGPPPGLLLVPEGVFCRMPAGTAWLPWFTIAEVDLGGFRGQQWVAFKLDHDAEGAVLTGPARWLRRANHGFGMDVGYPAQALALPPEDVVALLQRLHGDPGLRAQLRDPSILATLRRPDASAWRRW